MSWAAKPNYPLPAGLMDRRPSGCLAAMAAVDDMVGINPLEKLVLYALTDGIGEWGEMRYRKEVIKNKCCMTDSQYDNAIKSLLSRGLIVFHNVNPNSGEEEPMLFFNFERSY